LIKTLFFYPIGFQKRYSSTNEEDLENLGMVSQNNLEFKDKTDTKGYHCSAFQILRSRKICNKKNIYLF